MNVLGLDVGFARNRATSGIAHLGDAGLKLGRTTSEWTDRKRILGPIDGLEVSAIDAPVVRSTHNGSRDVERLFTFGLFQRRCKPGLSHIRGTGQQLRQAGIETARQTAPLTSDRNLRVEFPRVWEGGNIVEAFPNAFLGVCLDDDTYENRPKLKRGRKFDWLYDQWLKQNLFRRLVELLGLGQHRDLLDACQNNRQHDERSALVCLLTAACVAAGKYTAVGEKLGGYFFLPPWEFWSPWARREVDDQRKRVPWVDVWIEGLSHGPKEPLHAVEEQRRCRVVLGPDTCKNC